MTDLNELLERVTPAEAQMLKDIVEGDDDLKIPASSKTFRSLVRLRLVFEWEDGDLNPRTRETPLGTKLVSALISKGSQS